MTEKILFLIDGWFLHYCIAKSLQSKYDADLYAIIDIDDKARHFFEEQQMVKFNKVWYFIDNVKNIGKPDLEYLANIEKKYKINLWNIVYLEREFYGYNQFYQFSEEEILSMVEQECRFFEKILDDVNPEFLCMFQAQHHHQLILLELCKSRSVKVMMLSPARFGNRMMISQDGFTIDYMLDIYDKFLYKSQKLESLENYLKQFDSSKEISEYKKEQFESHTLKRYVSILKFFVSKKMPNYKYRYSNYGKTRTRVLFKKISNFLKKRYRTNFINNQLSYNVSTDIPFVYYPLHYEPESIFITAPFYTDQLAIIVNIARALPVGYKLYVKDHPAMKNIGWRDISYYKKIMNLPNVVLIHPSVSPEEIYKKCSFVVTIAGTAGREAPFYGKPVICLTEQLYSVLPCVLQLTNIKDLPDFIKLALKIKVDPTDLEKFIEVVNENTFELNLINITADFSYRFGFKGPVMDAYLPIPKVQQFLEDYSSVFELLAVEHIKKMKQLKQFESKMSEV